MVYPGPGSGDRLCVNQRDDRGNRVVLGRGSLSSGTTRQTAICLLERLSRGDGARPSRVNPFPDDDDVDDADGVLPVATVVAVVVAELLVPVLLFVEGTDAVDMDGLPLLVLSPGRVGFVPVGVLLAGDELCADDAAAA